MKIKLDETLPASAARMLRTHGHDVDTVANEQLTGVSDQRLWRAVLAEDRFLITQDLDFFPIPAALLPARIPGY